MAPRTAAIVKERQRLLYPLFIFLFSVAALGLSLFLYIRWYMEASARLQALTGRFHLAPEQFRQGETWVVIVVLSLLVGLILAGVAIIFIYHLKTWQLYRLQNNFINAFTHELKTPVTSIKLYLETFKKHELEREQELKYIDYMLNDANRLSGHINRILSLAKIESGTYEGRLEAVDLEAFVRDFAARNRYLFAHCEITIAPPPGGPLIQPLDPSLFEILLLNLLSNASRYHGSRPAELAIAFTRSAKSVAISFRDNGIGFAPQEGKKIFKKFYRLREQEAPDSTGLGLYLVERIAKIHRGKIAAASPGPGQGATFTLTLPAVRRER